MSNGLKNGELAEVDSAATLTADFLVANGVKRVFGLQGGHIQPVWDQLARRGVEIVDVRHEAAAVHMAHAHAELTGQLGVALVTAGPGVTNTVTSIANAHVARASILVLGGCAPGPQANMGALQDIAHTEIMLPITRRSRTLRDADQVLRELAEGVSMAFGVGGDPGPVYLEIPTEVLRTTVPKGVIMEEFLQPVPIPRTAADAQNVAEFANLMINSKKIAVITGRGARFAGDEICELLETSGAAYLDTQESRGLVPDDNPAYVGAMRARVMSECDLVITVGRRFDYQLGYGSPAAFPNAKVARISDTSAEIIDNRRGEAELLCSIDDALSQVSAALTASGHEPDTTWRDQIREKHLARVEKYGQALAQAPDGSDGFMHPNKIFAAANEAGLEDAVTIADGGDFLSFARLGAPGSTYLDAGAFGCLGISVPFAIAAALENPDRTVVAFTGDGAYGLNAMEINTAARHGAKVVIIVADNRAWNIERYDQETNYGLVAGTDLGQADYADMAIALGAYGERVSESKELGGAISRAIANAPAVIHVDVTKEAVSPDAQKGLGYVPAYQALTPWNDAEVRRRQL